MALITSLSVVSRVGVEKIPQKCISGSNCCRIGLQCQQCCSKGRLSRFHIGSRSTLSAQRQSCTEASRSTGLDVVSGLIWAIGNRSGQQLAGLVIVDGMQDEWGFSVPVRDGIFVLFFRCSG